MDDSGMARRTKLTNESPQELATLFLANYTQCEGLAEDIGYAYLSMAPLEVIEPLLLRRPWPSDAMADMLRAILRREDFTVTEAVRSWAVFRDEGITSGDVGLVAEWKWATQVRNDLAHSSGQWKDTTRREGLGLMSEEEMDRKFLSTGNLSHGPSVTRSKS